MVLRWDLPDLTRQAVLARERFLDESRRSFDPLWRVRLARLEQSAGKSSAQRTGFMQQPALLRAIRATHFDASDPRPLRCGHGEGDIHKLVGIVDPRSRVDLRLEISIVLQKLQQCRFCKRNTGRIVRVFILQVHHLQQARIREQLRELAKFHNPQVVCGLKNEVQPQTQYVRNHVDSDLFKATRAL